MPNLYIYFHKDFDGLVAAALFIKINQETQLIGANNYTLKPVDYEVKKIWLKTNLEHPNVVIDFLYHPEADWWFDHHVSTFLNANHEKHYKNTETRYWDVNFPSCAALIKGNLEKKCSLFMSNDEYKKITDGFKEWIIWSDIIDNAKYESPSQIVELKHPCLQINSTILPDIEDNYIEHLVTAVKMFSPEEVAETTIVRKKIEIILKTQTEQMEVFKKGYKIIQPQIGFFDYVKYQMPFQRYLFYYFEPEAFYSIGIYGRTGKYAVSVGKNPWKEFQSKNIGTICETFGGGGRLNVGSVLVSNYKKALSMANTISSKLSV
jgi:hypothetical protein